MLDQAWVGVDVGTDHHWAAAVDADGRLLVDVDGAEHVVSAGDVVHVRPAAD